MNVRDPGSEASFEWLRHAHRSERAPDALRRRVLEQTRGGRLRSPRNVPRAQRSLSRSSWLALAAAVVGGVAGGVWLGVARHVVDSPAEPAAGPAGVTPMAEPARPNTPSRACPPPLFGSLWELAQVDPAAKITGLEGKALQTEIAGCEPLVRRYLVRPPATPKASAPVLLVLHDGGQSAEVAQIATRWWFDDVTVRKSALLVYANGGPIAPRQNGWQIKSGVWQTDAEAYPSVDDVAYLQAIIDDLRTVRGLAQGDVFLAGYGSGAVMALVAALQHPERYAGVAAFLPDRAPRKAELGAALAASGQRRLRSVFVVLPKTAEGPSALAFEWAALLGSEPGGVRVTRQRPGISRIDTTLAGGVALRILRLPGQVDPFPPPGGAEPLARAASEKQPFFFDGAGAAWDFFERASP
jgi:predicted esterase